jgi:hypothetical protein
MPKFVLPPKYPDLRLVGTAGGVTAIPLARVRIGPGVSSYETLFSFLDAEGTPMAAAYPGTYGPYLMRAGRGR